MRRFLLALFFISALMFRSETVFGQADGMVSDIVVAYDFGEQIIIHGRVNPQYSGKPVSIQLFLPDDPETLTTPLPIDETGTFTFTHLPAERIVRAFSDVTFRFVVEQADGSILESESYSFFYSDNRFEWRTLESAPFRVHWYAGEVAFAQQVLDAAARGLERTASYFTVQPPWFDIYVYADVNTYRTMRGALGSLWAGGHVQPESGLVIVSLTEGPDSTAEIDRKIPHEVAHLALYLFAREGFGNLPTWFNEGFASMMETYPNPDYAYLVSKASDDGTLFPLSELCAGFPQETAGALLAYAQSEAVVRYIDQAYGPAGVRALLESYASGAGCSLGPLVEPIRFDLETLETAWRSGITPAPESPAETEPAGALTADTLSWLIIFAAVIAGPGLVLLGAGLKKGK